MSLTKEQLAALKRVIAYMNRMYGIASPYYGCTGDANILRAMIDSSEHVTDHTKMIGFDLEKARAEVATASARRFSESREQARIFCAEEILPDALDEIERLRANLGATEERVREFESHENQTHAILGAILGTDDTLENVAKRAMARIAELEKWLKKERSARLLEQSGSIRLAYLVENKIDFDEFFDGKALEQLQADGKISIGDHIVGPDQMVPCWQITEERKAAIDRGLQFLEWSYAKNSAHDTKEQIAVLWAMLREAE